MSEAMRAIDDGRPFFIPENAGEWSGRCARGVRVETRLDSSCAVDEIVLQLARAERHDGGLTDVDAEHVVTVRLSLGSGRCSAHDEEAEAFLTEHPWLQDAFARSPEGLQARARRTAAQRDRETSCIERLDRAEPGILIPYDELFPADWDLLVKHDDGRTYWVMDSHCSNPSCLCAEIIVDVHALDDSPNVELVGKLRLDLRAKASRPTATTARVARLVDPIWSRHGAELMRRRGDVRRIVAAQATSPAPTNLPDAVERPRPGRNASCLCGSGKKYKRCCLGRDPRRDGPPSVMPR